MVNLDEIPLRKDFTLSARISFLALGEAHIDLLADPQPEDEVFAEQLLYCCMALRQLVNMKSNSQVHTLEHFLRSTAMWRHANIESMQNRQVTLVKTRRKRARIEFPAKLFLRNRELGFTVRLAKSTLFMRNLLKYATASVPALYYFLADRHLNDENYTMQLSLIGGLAAYTFHSSQLTADNQLPGAVSIVLGLRTGKYSDLEEELTRFWQDA